MKGCCYLKSSVSFLQLLSFSQLELPTALIIMSNPVSSHGKRFFRKCVEHTKLLRCPISLECFDQAQRLFTFEFVEVISNVEIKSSEHGLDKPNLTPMIHNCLSLVYASFPRMLSSCLGVVYFIAEAFASGLSSFQSSSRKIFYYFVSTYLIST